MLPPVLEVYVLWHPADEEGRRIAQDVVSHFHGTVFSGLIGGAVEVYVRSAPWRSGADAPRPIPVIHAALPARIREAQFVVVVPILGVEMARAVEQGGPWRKYIEDLSAAKDAMPNRVAIFPYRAGGTRIDGGILDACLSKFQRIGAGPIAGESDTSVCCRDLAQGIAQSFSKEKRLTVFISHTKRSSVAEKEDVAALIATVRDVISGTRLKEFFDAHDLQPGENWDDELRARAGTSALLAIRTDLYPTREWCQREVLIAKRAEMSVIVMDAIGDGEERGSFLMDHVPRIPARMTEGKWRPLDVVRALNLLVDESLKRVLWQHQKDLARAEGAIDVAWWASHAPEPITLTYWLDSQIRQGRLKPEGDDLLVLHPDPPLGPDEKDVLQEIARIAGMKRNLDIMTPRLLAARSG